MNTNDTELAILSALLRKPLYGLALIGEVARVSEDRVKLTLGGIYPILHRMQEKGFIEGNWGDDSETRHGARRRYYRVTGLGEQALRDTHRMVSKAMRWKPAHA
jgi:PadR family transcriptional regulator, regulatory protein PadR